LPLLAEHTRIGFAVDGRLSNLNTINGNRHSVPNSALVGPKWKAPRRPLSSPLTCAAVLWSAALQIFSIMSGWGGQRSSVSVTEDRTD
jgi:hypothetical protein